MFFSTHVPSLAHFCEISNGRGVFCGFCRPITSLILLAKLYILVHCVPKDRVTKFLLEKFEKKTKNFRHSTPLKQQ